VRVRYVAPGRAPAGGRRSSGFLSVGAEYVVLAISVSRRGIDLLLLDDQAQRPGWHPAGDFDLVSDSIPSNWKVQVGVGGSVDSLEIAPAAWLEPRFFVDYWGDDPGAAKAADEIFQRELATILIESGS
jgi:hypothetical protein